MSNASPMECIQLSNELSLGFLSMLRLRKARKELRKDPLKGLKGKRVGGKIITTKANWDKFSPPKLSNDELELAYRSKGKFGPVLHSLLTKGSNGLEQAKKTRSSRLVKQAKLTRIKSLGKVGKVGAAVAAAGAIGYGINKLRKR